jgi:hypothetical protein
MENLITNEDIKSQTNNYDSNSEYGDINLINNLPTSYQSNKPKNTLPENEINKILSNSTEIEKKEWIKLCFNDYISYEKKDGTFSKGGYIKNIIRTESNKLMFKILLESTSNYNKPYSIYFTTIKKLYKRNFINNNNSTNLDDNNINNTDFINNVLKPLFLESEYKLNILEKKINIFDDKIKSIDIVINDIKDLERAIMKNLNDIQNNKTNIITIKKNLTDTILKIKKLHNLS